jgi:peptidoglycan/LPS O-acetylase OafA/YrhL
MSSEKHLTERAQDAEIYLRFHRRSMLALLFLIMAAGAFVVMTALKPDATVLRWIERAPFFFPMLIIIVAAVQQTVMRRHRLALDSPEFKALMSDEWRLRSMDRATRGALIVALVAQLALPFLFAGLSTPRALWGMAAATVTIGLAAQVALFLFFDRE